jgi:hypothetical protein
MIRGKSTFDLWEGRIFLDFREEAAAVEVIDRPTTGRSLEASHLIVLPMLSVIVSNKGWPDTPQNVPLSAAAGPGGFAVAAWPDSESSPESAKPHCPSQLACPARVTVRPRPAESCTGRRHPGRRPSHAGGQRERFKFKFNLKSRSPGH